mmetsp:Transcript_24136/g.51247  ORF Transcript_24136/g.51247 Transcript_24136/m.51247 type:complete len:301 (+) Transcript_24136:95-997(+)|eukprot:CAMPEP_0201117112 /NCGR_PEP_ID=MMETSP0850-20130426/1184_1 /ASSEMBLY_ACC=CAM_ASM_000622 /TAXON_ID=183588 /ORGANISM="Pseudo-nitzschia fraudulenta, Strain WWA7" /LENGTH=300 /DNA_ID=CAMNT_0047381353 /DNA_START=68 /DNA_END=970 /DNA_ORIENTATION=+
MDISCILCAILFFIGNLLKLIFFGKERNRDFQWRKFTQLEPEAIQAEWDFRIEHKPRLLAIGIISSLAWFIFCFPMLQLVYVLNRSRNGPGTISRSLWLHAGILILVLGGAFLEWIAFFLYMGSTLACEMMVDSFNLSDWDIKDSGNDNVGLRTLEVAYFAIRGMKFWVDAFEWIALSVIMIFTYLAVLRHRKAETDSAFGGVWNTIGLFIGFLSILDFVTEILRTVNFRLFSQLAFWYGTANRLVLLPTWLVLLGWRLPYAIVKLEQDKEVANRHPEDQQQNLLMTTTIDENPVIVEGL